jgi:hypothetical protein
VPTRLRSDHPDPQEPLHPATSRHPLTGEGSLPGQPRPHDRAGSNRGGCRTTPPVAGSAEGRPGRADLCSIRQWRPSSEKCKYSAICAETVPSLAVRAVLPPGNVYVCASA